MKKLTCLCIALTIIHYGFSQANTKPAPKPKTATAAVKTVPPPKPKGRMVQLTTDFGVMVIRLYDSTPLHRDNFIKLVQQGFYDSLMFHRVINQFMIQGGDPNSKNAGPGEMLGAGSAPGDRIPAEFAPNLFHKKGVLAAARDMNPQKASSNCQFYIVQGKPYTDDELNGMECQQREQNISFRFSDAQRNAYKTIGGTPFLDQNYTVFGEVIKGIEVLDKIAAVQCDGNNRPLQDVRMKMKMLN